MAKTAGSGAVGLLLLLLLLVSGATGAWVAIDSGALPIWRSMAAGDWLEVPCTIERADIASHRSSKGRMTYWIQVSYTYRVGSIAYRGDRYAFARASSSDPDEPTTLVERYRQQPAQRCWVDPDRPASAVLDRGVPDGAWEVAVFGGVFSGAGVLVLGVMARQWRRNRRRAALGEAEPRSEGISDAPVASAPIAADPGPRRLTAPGPRRGGAYALLGFAIAVNACSWAIFLVTPSGSRWFVVLFLVAGAFLALLALGRLRALSNPVPTLELDSGVLRQGGRTLVRWSWTGDHRRMVRLRVLLICRAEARFRRGKGTATAREELERIVIFSSSEVGEGSASLSIPESGLPSFAATNNRIGWLIRVIGEVPRCPDVDSEFPLTVLPSANAPVADPGGDRSEGPIVLAGGRTTYRPGDTVAGRIRWSLTGMRDRLELRLFWHTAGKGITDAAVVDRLVVDAPGATGEQEFVLHLPAAGPVSCSSPLVSVLWALELVAEPGGAVGVVDLIVGPAGVAPHPA